LAHTQFQARLQAIQCDNGREFDNSLLHTFAKNHGIALRFSCPYTSQQNGKAERIIRTLNDITRTLLLQASMPPRFWVEALHTAVLLHNRLPSKAIAGRVPFRALLGKDPSYAGLRVFGCLCYPNTSAVAPHKLAPRSVPCVFLGYPSHHLGYRCLDRSTQKIIISRHVVFDETSFPFANTVSSPSSTPSSHTYEFLQVPEQTMVPTPYTVPATVAPAEPPAAPLAADRPSASRQPVAPRFSATADEPAASSPAADRPSAAGQPAAPGFSAAAAPSATISPPELAAPAPVR
jgi:hypothetical protein